MLFLLASVAIGNETFRSLLQNAFAYATVLFVDHTILVLLALMLLAFGGGSLNWLWHSRSSAAAATSLKSSSPSASSENPNVSTPQPKWAVLHALNYIVLFTAMISTWCIFNEHNSLEDLIHPSPSLSLTDILPHLLAFLSLVYFFGFFGISFVLSHVQSENAVQWMSSGQIPNGRNAAECVMKDADIIIVGAGTAGASLAFAMAEQGRKVLIIERSWDIQHRIVGELLQPGGLNALREIGLEDCALGDESGTVIDSVRVNGYALFSPQTTEKILLPYPQEVPQTFLERFGFISYAQNESDSKPFGTGFHNGRFVQRIREKILSHPNVTAIHGTVGGLIMNKKKNVVCGVEYKEVFPENEGVAKGCSRVVYAPVTVVADGMWSSLRRSVSNQKPEVISNFVGTIINHPPQDPPLLFANHGHVVLASPSPILMYQISSTETRVLVDIPGKVPRASNGDLKKFLIDKMAPQLPAQAQSKYIHSLSLEGNIRVMPNRSLTISSASSMDGTILLGDALNMRHPLTGGGMTVALQDVVLLSKLLADVDLENVRLVSSLYAKFSKTRLEHSSTVNILANALYHVFSTPADDKIRATLQLACVKYLKQGGVYSAGPVGLLACLTPQPMILVVHFFMVAWFGVFQTLFPYPSLEGLKECYELIHAACKIIMPLIEDQNTGILACKPVRMTVNMFFPYK